MFSTDKLTPNFSKKKKKRIAEEHNEKATVIITQKKIAAANSKLLFCHVTTFEKPFLKKCF